MNNFLTQQSNPALIVNSVDLDANIKQLEEYYTLKPTVIMKDEEISFDIRIQEIEKIAQQQENELCQNNEKLKKDRYREQDFYFMGDPPETDEADQVHMKIPEFVKLTNFKSQRSFKEVLNIRGWANLPIEFSQMYQIEVEMKPKDFEYFPLIRIDKIQNQFLYNQLKKEKIREVRTKIENSLYNIDAVKLLTQENIEKRAQIYAKLFVRNIRKKQDDNFFFQAMPEQDFDFGDDSNQIPTQQELNEEEYKLKQEEIQNKAKEILQRQQIAEKIKREVVLIIENFEQQIIIHYQSQNFDAIIEQKKIIFSQEFMKFLTNKLNYSEFSENFLREILIYKIKNALN